MANNEKPLVTDRRKFTAEGDLRPGVVLESHDKGAQSPESLRRQAEMLKLREDIQRLIDEVDRMQNRFRALFDSLPPEEQEAIANRMGFSLAEKPHAPIGFVHTQEHQESKEEARRRSAPIGFHPQKEK